MGKDSVLAAIEASRQRFVSMAADLWDHPARARSSEV